MIYYLCFCPQDRARIQLPRLPPRPPLFLPSTTHIHPGLFRCTTHETHDMVLQTLPPAPGPQLRPPHLTTHRPLPSLPPYPLPLLLHPLHHLRPPVPPDRLLRPCLMQQPIRPVIRPRQKDIPPEPDVLQDQHAEVRWDDGKVDDLCRGEYA